VWRVLFIGGKRDLERDDSLRWEFLAPEDDLLDAFPRSKPDLVVFEARDPEVAKGVLEDLRALGGGVPLPFIVILSPSLLALDNLIGEAHDFILEPYHPKELAIRVRKALRRIFPSEKEGILRAGDLTIDLKARRVTLGGEPVLLTFKEYELLKLLATNPGRVFSRETLLNRIWGYDYFGGERTVDVHIRRLRAKIEKGGNTFIETVRGVGYRFREIPRERL